MKTKLPLVELKNLTKNYDKKIALKNVNLKLENQKIYGLLGKNGSGKTTLIKLINDLLTPSEGEVLIKGKKPGIESKKIVSYLPERTYLDKSLTVKTAIKEFADFYPDFSFKKAKKLLTQLELDENQKILKMSKGMQEKLQLLLVMSRRAELYILDEPFSGVDPATRDDILDLILENFEENSSLLISTHLISDVERILDEVIFIKNGEIVEFSNAEKLREKENASIDEIFRRRFKNVK
ncbi:ABC transporter ATP-binding protein [Candidatus Saccharibacteria bacterium]|nr:ABC transporter ATP-binding protein [Candidatus Saccharibacteria bacterium]